MSNHPNRSKRRTNVTIRKIKIDANDTFQQCYCGAGKRGRKCDVCGFTPQDEILSIEEGTVWERVDTKDGSATFSYNADDEDMRKLRLKEALRRIIGHSVDIGWGHYGQYCKTGGLSVEGKYSTVRI